MACHHPSEQYTKKRSRSAQLVEESKCCPEGHALVVRRSECTITPVNRSQGNDKTEQVVGESLRRDLSLTIISIWIKTRDYNAIYWVRKPRVGVLPTATLSCGLMLSYCKCHFNTHSGQFYSAESMLIVSIWDFLREIMAPEWTKLAPYFICGGLSKFVTGHT